jgi:CheY-like chemotaxis protein
VNVDQQYAVLNRELVAGQYIVIEVTDSGSGMPKEIIDRIFEPFFTTKEIGKGTGLGLSTVLGILRSHGGFVSVNSEPGKGSTFKIFLPAQTDGRVDGTIGPTPVLPPRGDGELVLVVDDETPVLDITKQTLSAFGYKVVVAKNGAQATALFAQMQDEVAAVITDMMMPVMDGVALINALRCIDPKVRIIAASGLNDNTNVARASTAGVKHFLAKPYSAEVLLSLLRQVLRDTDSPP